MPLIAADTFAAAVAISFQSRGEFGIGRPGPLLDMWLGQQSDEVVLSMVVDPSSATEENGHHMVCADIIGETGGHRWGIRIHLAGYPEALPGSDAPHWIVDISDIHAPALSLKRQDGPAAETLAVTAPSAADCAQADTADRVRAILPGIDAVI